MSPISARRSRGAVALAVLGLLTAFPVRAATLTWNGSANRRWSNAPNWTPAAAPTLADDTVVPNGAANINPLRVNGGIDGVARTLTFSAGANVVSLTCNGTTLTLAGNGASGFTSSATTVSSTCPITITNGQISVAGTLSLTGTLTTTALTKSGVGILNLNGGGTIGSIALNAGTLFLGSTLTGTTVAVASGATLGGTGGVTGAVTVAAGGTVDPGAVAGTGALATGPLTMSAGTTLDINFSAVTTHTQLNVTGTATVAGTVNITGTVPTDGTYTLVSATGALTNGGVQLGTTPSGKAFGLRVVANTLVVDVATVPIRIDSTSTASSTCTGNLTWSHTVGNGNDRYLIVGVSTSSGAGVSPTAVTYGAAALTLLASDGGGTTRVFIFGLLAPAVGTAGVVVTMPAAATCGAVGGSMSYTGVNQAGAIGNTNTTVGTSAAPATTVTLTQGDRAVSVLSATNVATATQQAGATLRYRVAQSPVLGASSTVDNRTNATINNAPISWTLPSSQAWSLSVVGLHAVAPTRETSAAPTVRATDRGSAVSWRAGPGLDVVGYRIWREVGGQRTLLTPGLLEGPAMQSRASALAGRRYGWEDSIASGGARYWLESLHTSGKTTWEAATALPGKAASAASSVAILGDQSVVGTTRSAVRRGPQQAGLVMAPGGDASTQWRLAGSAAAKLGVRAEGVYHVPAEVLFGAGVPRGAAVGSLQLFRDGRQVSMDVLSADGVHLQPGDAVEFYGTGADTRYTDTAVYWLLSGQGAGRALSSAGGPPPGASPATYLEARELRERLAWFGAAQNGDAEKFFGVAVRDTPVVHVFGVDQLDPAAGGAFVDVALIGLVDGPHAVTVNVNGLGLGTVNFDGLTPGTATLPLPPGLLVEGDAQVTLTSAASGDISLEDHIRLVYPRRTARATGPLVFSLLGGSTTSLSGFPAATTRVLDVTDPTAPVHLAVADDGTGAASVLASGGGPRRLLAYLPEDMAQPASVTANVPSVLHAETYGADLVIVAPADLLAAVAPLVQQRQAEGLRVLTVDVEDVRDEYAFGAKSAQALRDYLQQAIGQWSHRPRFVLLAGEATFDPRDYLGLGGDLVSSGTVQTDFTEAASDHWFVDFPGGESVAVGRFPVKTADEAALLTSKILARQPAGPAASVLLVADQLGTSDFQSHLQETASRLPSATLQWIVRGTDTDQVLHDQLLARLRQGPSLVDYAGHGSELFWAGNLHDVDDVPALTGSGKTSLYVHMTCLTGFFQDPRHQSLAVATLLTANGGAWGAWASTGQSYPSDHPAVNASLVDALVNQGQTLGEATRAALASTDDATLKNTFVLLGDPSARLAPAKRPALTVDAPASSSGCGAVETPASALAALLAAAWLLRRRSLAPSRASR